MYLTIRNRSMVRTIGQKILVVDDDPGIVRMLLLMLKKIRPEDSISSVYTCKDALDRISHESFDVIISDYNLPDGSGKTIFSQSKPNVFKVGISGSHRELDFEHQCNRFLPKPFGVKDLQSILDFR